MHVERPIRVASALGFGFLLLAQGPSPVAALQDPVECFVLDQGCINDSVRQDQAFVLTNALGILGDALGDVLTDDAGRPFQDWETAIVHLFRTVPEPPTVVGPHGAISFASPYEEFGFSGEAQLQCRPQWLIFSVPGEEREILRFRLAYTDRSHSPLEVLGLLPTEGEWVLPRMITSSPLEGLYRTGALPDLSERATPLPVSLRTVDLQFNLESTTPGTAPYERLDSHQATGTGAATLHGTIHLSRTPDGEVEAVIEGLLWPGLVGVEGRPVRTLVPLAAAFRARPDSSCE
jgi:hypothetical protein